MIKFLQATTLIHFPALLWNTLRCKLLQNYYNVYGVQQFSAYYPSAGASGAVGLIHNIYPYYGQYAQSIQAQGFGVQYPQMPQFPFLPHPYGSTGILSYPSSVSVPTTTAGDIFNAKTCYFLLALLT